MTLCSSSGVSQLRPSVRYACLPHAEGPFSIRERAYQRRSPALATAPAHHLTPAELVWWVNPIVRGWMSYYGRFYRSAPYPLLGRINHYMMR
ncbi:MAG TPA: group II intron maturase-specific domain-containing protein [Gemmatimonadales bacterium]|nr:group II intron maturase-specific domain-containing protein [Gemmatimonadales bacterium]